MVGVLNRSIATHKSNVTVGSIPYCISIEIYGYREFVHTGRGQAWIKRVVSHQVNRPKV